MPAQLSKRQLSFILLFITAAIWGIATPVVKATVEYVPPFTFLMIRFWISGLVTIPFTIYFLKKHKLSKKRMKHIFVAAMLGQVLAMSFAFTALSMTNAVNAVVITSFAPLFTMILGYVILRELIRRREIEGALIAFIGTMVIVLEPIISGNGGLFNGGRNAFIGNILVLIAVLIDSTYPVYIKKYISEDKVVSPMMQIIIAFSIATIVFTPLGLAEQYKLYKSNHMNTLPGCTIGQIDKFIYDAGIKCDSQGCFTNENTSSYICAIDANQISFWKTFNIKLQSYFTGKGIWGILYMAFVSGLLGYILFSNGLKNIDTGEASVFYYLQPLFAIPVAIIFLGESISTVFILGAIIIMIGIYFAEKRG